MRKYSNIYNVQYSHDDNKGSRVEGQYICGVVAMDAEQAAYIVREEYKHMFKNLKIDNVERT